MPQTLKYKNTIEQVNYYSLLLFLFWLPLKDDYLPPILALWILSWLLLGNFKERLRIFPENYLYAGLLFYFILTILALFKSNDLEYGFFHVQEKLSMVFFPIFLIGASNKIKANIKTILIVFIIGNLIASIYCLSYTFIDCIQVKNGSYVLDYHITPGNYSESFWQLVNLRYNRFSYNYLSIFKHPSYFSMFITFSALTIIQFFRKKMINKTGTKILYGLLMLFFVFMLYLLQSRAAFITFGIVMVLIPLIELKKKLKKRFIFLTIALFAVAFSFISTSSSIRTNIIGIVKFFGNENKTQLINSDTRLQLWYTSAKVIQDNFWFGTSPANLTDELVKKYEELGFEGAAEQKLNSHNQYLETFAGLGVFGFLSLMFIIIFTFIISIKQKHYLLFFLMVILSVNFLFESMLNRMAGVLFMMFFVSLFVFMEQLSKEQISPKEMIE